MPKEPAQANSGLTLRFGKAGQFCRQPFGLVGDQRIPVRLVGELLVLAAADDAAVGRCLI